jgi:hypothetical protein
METFIHFELCGCQSNQKQTTLQVQVDYCRQNKGPRQTIRNITTALQDVGSLKCLETNVTQSQ